MSEFHRLNAILPDDTRPVFYLGDWIHYYDRTDLTYITSERIVGNRITRMRLLDQPVYPGGPCPCRQCQ